MFPTFLELQGDGRHGDLVDDTCSLCKVLCTGLSCIGAQPLSLNESFTMSVKEHHSMLQIHLFHTLIRQSIKFHFLFHFLFMK